MGVKARCNAAPFRTTSLWIFRRGRHFFTENDKAYISSIFSWRENGKIRRYNLNVLWFLWMSFNIRITVHSYNVYVGETNFSSTLFALSNRSPTSCSFTRPNARSKKSLLLILFKRRLISRHSCLARKYSSASQILSVRSSSSEWPRIRQNGWSSCISFLSAPHGWFNAVLIVELVFFDISFILCKDLITVSSN